MRSNTYDHTFTATCPNDGASISYSLNIETTGVVVMAEAIEGACAFAAPVYHEDIADQLHSLFGGHQVLSATHGGVRVTTRRA